MTTPATIPPLRSLDELAPGQTYDLGGFALSEAEVIEFARRYDPQPFHLDREAARESLFGELVASGLHTLAATFGHLMRSGWLAAVSLGGNRIDTRWPAPLRPGEPVRLKVEVLEVQPSRSGRPLGVAKLRYLLAREADGVVVLDSVGTHFLRR
ncbi:MaoC/PaaZ C-terminal domain-containing protein [Caldovatus aquaticus]|uniref:Dehydratase n=1 Tax=Caldovatus aquaticus TaxID=2865671 RepID=A0ABS7EXE9_9PROT|nr:MaoC/PaaZ C-terminal domain-containing protein [Caldovatus aquaticus]MBW8268040.1 dehydratase [Caldovatus aquaticus]